MSEADCINDKTIAKFDTYINLVFTTAFVPLKGITVRYLALEGVALAVLSLASLSKEFSGF
jgi:hypothetical protein